MKKMLLGSYTVEVMDGKCRFPREWSFFREKGMKWAKAFRKEKAWWYLLIPARQMIKDIEAQQGTRVVDLGSAVFSENGMLCLPEDLKGSITLLGCYDRIEVLSQDEMERIDADFESLIPETIDFRDAIKRDKTI